MYTLSACIYKDKCQGCSFFETVSPSRSADCRQKLDFLLMLLLFSFVVSEPAWQMEFMLLQVPASTHYSMVFYFVSKPLVPGSLLQLFVDGDDEFRNSRFKLIPAVPKVFILFMKFLILYPTQMDQICISSQRTPPILFVFWRYLILTPLDGLESDVSL